MKCTKIMLGGLVALTATAFAMPTPEQTKKVEPLVVDLMRADQDALKSGKKTRVEVAESAMELAEKADSEAAKLLLLKGAFNLYVRAGEFDKAIETLQSLQAAIPDIPPANVANIIEASLRGVPKKEDGARLYKLLDEKRGDGASVQGTDSGTIAQPETNQQAFSRMFPGWQTSVEPTFVFRHRGQSSVAYVHPPSQETPAVVSRTLTLPPKNPCLFLKMASFDEGSDFLLSVLVDGKEVLPKRLICTLDSAPWQDITVPLSAWRGNKVKIEVVLTANGWWCEFPFFKRLEVAEGTGREKFAPMAKERVGGYTWSYRIDNGEATIVAENAGNYYCAVSPMPTGNVKIPATLGGVKVTGIGCGAFKDSRGLTGVTIPAGVTDIDRVAFLGCQALKSVTMCGERPNAPSNIFRKCDNLNEIHVPANAKSWAGMKDWQWLPLVFGNRSTSQSRRLPRRDVAKARSETNQQAFSRMFPGWQTSVEPVIGFRHRGQSSVAYVHPPSQETPAVVSRTLTLSKKNPCLFLKMASFDKGSDFLLSVLVDGKEVLPKRLICTPDYAPWQDITVPLSAWRGNKVKIEVVLTANNWWCEFPFFKRLEVAEGTGLEKFVPMANEIVGGYTWSYRIDNGEATIVAENAGNYYCAVSPMPTGDVKIPATLGGVKVTGIGCGAFKDSRGLTGVTIPAGVTDIDRGAFLGCQALKSMTMCGERPNAPSDLFSHSDNLNEIHVPANAKSWAGMKDWRWLPLVFDAK